MNYSFAKTRSAFVLFVALHSQTSIHVLNFKIKQQ